MVNLTDWLRRKPAPVALLIETKSGESMRIELGQGRTRWKHAEETLATCGAVSIQCLGPKDVVLRAKRLDNEAQAALEEGGLEGGESSGGGMSFEGYEKNAAKQTMAQAAMLDAYGRNLTAAFKAGAEASSEANGTLANMVDNLTGHLTIAITNLHTVATNFSNLLQTRPEVQEASGNGLDMPALISVVMQAMAAKAGLPAAPPPAPAKTNGKA